MFVYEARPELLFSSTKAEAKEGRFTFKKTIAILAVAAVFIGGILSLVASSYPDGLEWSIERLTGSTEIESAATGVYQTAGAIQEVTSILPDYAFKGSDTVLGTTFSGIVGSLIVLAVCVGACYLFKFFRKNKQA